ncbi:MAG: YbaK/EbsC family protein [Chloroflexi bacterium]|nr:YbaK/EbsC family protein [Chloroflexota bacterium]
MNSSDLAAFIAANGAAAEIIRTADHTPTVEAAAQALGVHVDQIVKSILLLADDSPVLVIANGTARVDLKRVADHLGLPRKRVKMADANAVLNLAGYAVGSMPPFGHKTQLRALIDSRAFEQSEVFAGGGEINAMLRIAPDEILRIVGGEKVEVTQNGS